MNANFKALADAVNALQATVDAQQLTIAALQDGNRDCPTGYARDATATTIVLCKKGPDEVVKVGTGATAIWVDRYEASVWDGADATGTQFGANSADYPSTFPASGRWTAPLFAVAKVGAKPAANLTWFQANAACRASGKRLLVGSEWVAAAMGTPETSPQCNMGGNTTVLPAGGSPQCASAWGAQDMVGNLWEWTDEWYPGVGDASTTGASSWPAGFGGSTANISSKVNDVGLTAGLPAGALRGGSSRDPGAGAFALLLDSSPARTHPYLGFRCVIPNR